MTAFAFLLAACSEARDPLRPVERLELERYLGQWHQVAALPAWFQQDCRANTTAQYSLLATGRLRIINACDTANGRIHAEARGRFTDVARMDVTFVDFFGWWLWPMGGEYWVIGLDADYRWAVVGQPARTYAWVLARDRHLDPDALNQVRAILIDNGYDPCAMDLC